MKKILSLILSAMLLSLGAAIPATAEGAEAIGAPRQIDTADVFTPAEVDEVPAQPDTIDPPTPPNTVEVPTQIEEGLGNSGKITAELNADLVKDLTLHAHGVNITFRPAEDRQYAELDATVIGINADDVTYDMKVTEEAAGLAINANHTGDDIGINRVVLTVYVNKDILENVTLDLSDSDLTMDGVNAHIMAGTMSDGELKGRDSHVNSLDVTLHDADLNYKGEVGGMTLNATGAEIDVDTSMIPAGVKIIGADTDVNLKVPDEPSGYTLRYALTDGKLSTNLAAGYAQDQGTITAGNGEIPVEVNLTDGDLHIEEVA